MILWRLMPKKWVGNRFIQLSRKLAGQPGGVVGSTNPNQGDRVCLQLTQAKEHGLDRPTSTPTHHSSFARGCAWHRFRGTKNHQIWVLTTPSYDWLCRLLVPYPVNTRIADKYLYRVLRVEVSSIVYVLSKQ